MRVPIENIYFLLCYALDHLQEMKYTQARCANCDSIWDLLARIMSRSAQQIAKRGLYRHYLLEQERLMRLRGKILVAESIRHPSISTPARYCEYDELNSDILPNRIIAVTLGMLQRHPHLSREQRLSVREAAALFAHCTPFPVRRQDFRRVVLNRNMRHYRFILSICELIHQHAIATPGSGDFKFHDFEQDDAFMGQLFEGFVRNFYRKEQQIYRVSAPRINWDINEPESTASGLSLLPDMKTDLCLTSGRDRLIIDCKFYRDLFQRHYDTRKFRSEHLYQLFCYLKNQSTQPGWEVVRGMLLYPTTTAHIDETVTISGHLIRVVTINLQQNAAAISRELLALINAG